MTFIKGQIPWNKGLPGLKGDKSPNWIGDKVGYFGIHDWLYVTFGKPVKCEQCGSEERVQWAKIKGKLYERKRENFWQLCFKCHMIYDKTGIQKAWNKGISPSLGIRQKMSLARLGKSPWNKGLKGRQPWHNISGLKYINN